MTEQRPRRNPGGTHDTPSGAVVWIPERSVSSSRRRNTIVAAVAGIATLLGMIAWWPANGGAVQATSIVLAEDTSFMVAAGVPPAAVDSQRTVEIVPDPVVVRPVMTAALSVVPQPRRAVYEDIQDDHGRRIAIRNEIARCKVASAACSADDVLRMGAELVQIRRRIEQARGVSLTAGKQAP